MSPAGRRSAPRSAGSRRASIPRGGEANAERGTRSAEHASVPRASLPRFAFRVPRLEPSVTPLPRVMRLRDVVLFNISAIVGLRWLTTAGRIGPASLVLWLPALVIFFLPSAGGPGFVHLAEHKGFIAAFSLGNLWIALGLNLIGLRIGKWVQNLGAYGTWLPAAIFVALALWSLVARGSATTFSAPALVPTHLDLPLLSLFATMTFAFAGLELAPTLGDEIHDPVATLRRGIALSGIGIVATYVLGTAAMLVALPAETVSVTNGMPQATAALTERLGVPWLAPAAALIAALLTIGNMGS